MKRLNDSPNHPLRFITESRTVGQFYNSWDKKFHLAEYKPYDMPPTKYLCGKIGNFSISRREGSRMTCADCWKGFEK